MATGRKLSVFLSYTFDPPSQAYNRAEIRSVVERACEIAQGSLRRLYPGIRFAVDAELTAYGGTLRAELCSKLRGANIAIIDIAEGNPNVYFELGFLAALNKPCILIAAENESRQSLPSDIAGALVLTYEGVGSIVGRLAERIRECALECLRIAARDPVQCRTVWGNLDQTGRPIVILGPRSSSRTDFMDINSSNYMFLDNLGDKDSIVELSILMARLFPACHVVRYVSDDVPRDAFEHNLVVVGGPGVPGSQGNRLVKTLQQRLGIDVTYSGDAKRLILPTKEEFSGVFEGRRCVLDYGFFAKARNPFNPSTHVFMFHGIYTMGVLGAARILSDHPSAQENVLAVIEEIGPEVDFWCVFPVHVLNGVPLVPVLDRNAVNLL
ncbi:MAG: hypothetical protein ACRDHG_10445 [Anaerolineales bacterium]